MPLDHSVDPMTVVARGAAVFAGTQRLAANPERRAEAAAQGVFTAALKYKPVGPDEDPPVTGEVSAPDGSFVREYNKDDVHPTLAGYKVMEDVIQKVLVKLLK